MVTLRNAATAAENKPAYIVPISAGINVNVDMRTHENEDPIGILLQALERLVVFLLCSL
jgi:hypothetical protein